MFLFALLHVQKTLINCSLRLPIIVLVELEYLLLGDKLDQCECGLSFQSNSNSRRVFT